MVIKEFKESRGLLPIRACVLGPPAVGKTHIVSQLCKHYKLHHIKIADVIKEAIEKLVSLRLYCTHDLASIVSHRSAVQLVLTLTPLILGLMTMTMTMMEMERMTMPEHRMLKRCLTCSRKTQRITMVATVISTSLTSTEGS